MSRHDQRGHHKVMGTCPLCHTVITTANDTAWRKVDGIVSRVHRACQEPTPRR